MEGYTARDALIIMRLDLTESLQSLEQELSDLEETLEFAGIAGVMLRDGGELLTYPAIRRWLETVGNERDLHRDREDLLQERADLVAALAHLEERLTGSGR